MPKNAIEIIYQDSNLLIINKPAGISVTSDRSGAKDILAALSKTLPEENDLRIVHRLDKFTSGIMLIAKNRQTQSTLTSQFEKQLIKKTYLALVSGFLPSPTGTIDDPISRNRKDQSVMRIDPRGKPAITNYKLIADFDLISLLAVEPVTERTHQIRLHLARNGFALAIDPIYGSSRPIMLSDFKSGYAVKKGRKEKPLIHRLTLHAWQIEIPALGSAPTKFIAPIDRKFAATIKMLTKYNPKGPDAFIVPENFSAILKARPLTL